jgi:hypothetical protein
MPWKCGNPEGISKEVGSRLYGFSYSVISMICSSAHVTGAALPKKVFRMWLETRPILVAIKRHVVAPVLPDFHSAEWLY